jgi:hypothetical protein
MPVDVTKLLTPADHRLVARAKKRGEKAAQKVMQAIARRAGQTAFERNEKISRACRPDRSRLAASVSREEDEMKPNWRRRAAQQAERDRGALRRLAMHEASQCFD